MENDVEVLTEEENELVRKIVRSLEYSPDGRCLECGYGRLRHYLRPTKCIAMVGILRARLGL